METLGQIAGGFSVALNPNYLLMAFLGVFMGTLVGVLPGLGPTSALAILLPLTAILDPTPAIIMLAGIYYGAMYGGSTTAILLNIPGEAASVPTCLDGYPLSRQGKGGPALGIAAIGSFLAGTMGLVGLSFFAPVLADKALHFGPPEYFSLMVLAFMVVVSLSGASPAKGIAMAGLGYFIALIGIGPSTGMPRLTMGSTALYGGLDLISIVVGLFAVSEILLGLEESRVAVAIGKIGRVFPSLDDLKKTLIPMVRGGVVGFLLGLLPGCSPAVTTFVAYDVEKRVSKHPEKFGKGAMEGVAAPEAANNATSSAGFIPLMSLGIPCSPPLAVLLGGLMIYGLQPGPLLFQKDPEFIWTVIASMYLGNVMLLVLNLPLVGLWVRLTKIPFGIMAPVILMFSVVGAYTVRNSMFDVGVCLFFGLFGYILRKFQWPVVPLLLSFILGPLLEMSLIQSLQMSGGSPVIFIERGISLTLLIAAVILFVLSIKLMKRTASRLTKEVTEDMGNVDAGSL